MSFDIRYDGRALLELVSIVDKNKDKSKEELNRAISNISKEAISKQFKEMWNFYCETSAGRISTDAFDSARCISSASSSKMFLERYYANDCMFRELFNHCAFSIRGAIFIIDKKTPVIIVTLVIEKCISIYITPDGYGLGHSNVKPKKVKLDIENLAKCIKDAEDIAIEMSAAPIINDEDVISVPDGLKTVYESFTSRPSSHYRDNFKQFLSWTQNHLRSSIGFHFSEYLSNRYSDYKRVPEYVDGIITQSREFHAYQLVSGSSFVSVAGNGIHLCIGLLPTFGLSIHVTNASAVKGKSIRVAINLADFNKTIDGIEKAIKYFQTTYTRKEVKVMESNTRVYDAVKKAIDSKEQSIMAKQMYIYNNLKEAIGNVMLITSSESQLAGYDKLFIATEDGKTRASIEVLDMHLSDAKSTIKVCVAKPFGNTTKKKNKELNLTSTTVISNILKLVEEE